MDKATADLTNEVIAALIAETGRITARSTWACFAQLLSITLAVVLLARWL